MEEFVDSDLPRGRRSATPGGEPATMNLGRMSIPTSLAAPGLARAAVEDWMPVTTARAILQDAVLLVSELVANSVVHSGAAAGAPIIVSACSAEGLMWFEVADTGRTGSVARRAPKGDGGMGLNLVDVVASQWGVSYGAGTKVWFELDCP